MSAGLRVQGDPARIDAPDAVGLAWDKQGGLLPAIVQDADDGRVLMLGYMDRAAYAATLDKGLVTFFSRSRQSQWTKGETSGHVLAVAAIAVDCDGDTLLVQAHPCGPTCHRGSRSCFDAAAPLGEPGSHATHAVAAPACATPAAVGTTLAALDARIARRVAERPPGSYTTRLLEDGVRRIAQKVGEEGVETALAAVAQGDEALLGEAADLAYHLIVLLHARGLSLADLERVLDARAR